MLLQKFKNFRLW